MPLIQRELGKTVDSLKGFSNLKARFPLPELTARVNGPTRLVETGRPSTRPVLTVMETGHPSTRAINSGRQLG